jgi:hypothetical protein
LAPYLFCGEEAEHRWSEEEKSVFGKTTSSNRKRIVESVGPARWCLAGSVSTTPGQLSRASLIRRADHLSPSIKFAKITQSILPVVEIHTPSGMVTLVNARVLSVGPSAPHSKGINTRDLYELLEIEFSFQKINVKCVDSKSVWKDDWKA